MDVLPVGLFGLRSSVNADIGHIAAELAYGTILPLHGQFVA